jgi:hypothetical protein
MNESGVPIQGPGALLTYSRIPTSEVLSLPRAEVGIIDQIGLNKAALQELCPYDFRFKVPPIAFTIQKEFPVSRPT